MGEIHGHSELPEIKKPEVENFKQVSPELKVKFDEAKSFWKDIFGSTDSNSSNGEIAGKEYYDDNGKLYRVEDNLLPNADFTVNGYEYKTDKLGRTASAEGKLRIREKEPGEKRDTGKMESMDIIGKGDQKEGDQRGHLIAWLFGGSDGLENLVPMEGKDLNQKDYANMEKMLADAVKSGSDVYLKVEPKYRGNSERPTEFRAIYSIDGERDTIVFKNRGAK